MLLYEWLTIKCSYSNTKLSMKKTRQENSFQTFAWMLKSFSNQERKVLCFSPQNKNDDIYDELSKQFQNDFNVDANVWKGFSCLVFFMLSFLISIFEQKKDMIHIWTLHEFIGENMQAGISNMEDIHEVTFLSFVFTTEDHCADPKSIIFQVCTEAWSSWILTKVA